MKSLKDALKSKGLQPTVAQNERKRVTKKTPKSVQHQIARNFCEDCNKVLPDVERYKHRIPRLEAQWLCVTCADKNYINDDCRQTNQSDLAKRGLFRRQFGRTKYFPKENKNRK